MKSVLIINSSSEYERMFQREGWEIVKEPPKNNKHFFIQFTGGVDVSPSFYGEQQHPKTISNIERDKQEQIVFENACYNKTPMAGICRGGQFLNVMNGGRLYQDVDGHMIIGTHPVLDVLSRRTYSVTSTHHQAMINKAGIIIAIAEKISTRKEFFPAGKKSIQIDTNLSIDTECIYYPITKSLCFQPHPEMYDAEECREYYFSYINEYLFNGELK